MKKNKQIKPKWFEGVIYPEGAIVRNPFSGEEYKLNALELSIYDFIIGTNLYLDLNEEKNPGGKPTDKSRKLIKDLYKGLDWFRENNAEAYMVLLD